MVSGTDSYVVVQQPKKRRHIELMKGKDYESRMTVLKFGPYLLKADFIRRM